ncbi:MAG: LamB/YcsF family protein [Bacteroidetes bacterium]|nr:LamB/YcsF family protein [Bacteroidota bacterium]
MKFDFNCDMGEGIGNDEALMRYITSANIACGFHAGDEDTMKKTIELCLKYNVKIGAHPSFRDRENFGRTDTLIPLPEVHSIVMEQIFLLEKIARELGANLHHVKFHGAMYNQAARAKPLAAVLSLAIKDTDMDLAVYGLSNSNIITEAKKIGLKTFNEVFADRTYTDNGSLTPRGRPNALIDSVDEAIAQVRTMTEKGYVISTNKIQVPVIADTVCIHSDGKYALNFAKAIYHSFRNS